MRRAALVLVLVGCATLSSPKPTPVAPTEPTPPTPQPPAAPPKAQPLSVKAPTRAPKPKPAPDPISLSEQQLARARAVQSYVAAAAIEHGVDANLLNGVIWAESKFNPKARNKSGASGLMQLMPKTGKAMAKQLQRAHRPFDPEFSIHAGAKLLSLLLAKFDRDEALALFGYARGSGSVRKWQSDGGEIPEGVRSFIARVHRAKQTFAALGFPATGPS